jgi:hypothetical protein
MNDTRQNTEFFDFLKEDYEVQPSDKHPAVTEIETHLPAISKYSLLAKNLAVADMQECSRALDLTSDIRSLHKTIEELRKKAIEPARRIVQMINDCAKGLQEILSLAETELKVKIAFYQKKEEERISAAEEAVKALSEQLGVEIAIPSDAKGVKSSKASSYYKETISFEITDESLIPDEYWMVNEELLQKHVELGKKDIPGIKIVKDKKFMIRRK